MKLLKFYQWITGTMSDFTRPFQNNEALYNQARSFWGHLEALSIIIIAICILLGIVMAISYYKPFNDRPGRHYKPIYWGWFLIGTIVLGFVTTLGFEYIAVTPKLNGALILELKIAFANALYSGIIYVLTSWLWCQFNFPTNAYRLIKF
ncbi:hypothetical protein [Bacteroides sp. UBA939]|uniref:hypothetical protein n=1 Tax=Bacteroides sp. UBA939 TaxID=1946092 RepID=UPI0025C118FD|nr:hypothetical protein [Bacteroides sp. UBA939]